MIFLPHQDFEAFHIVELRALVETMHQVVNENITEEHRHFLSKVV